MHPFLLAAIGGAIIGLSASLLLLVNGRIAGISGIVGGLLPPAEKAEVPWRLAFVAGLLVPGLVAVRLAPSAFDAEPSRNVGAILVAGFLVGLGTRIGSGCTSGHGICGLSRLSIRSLVAVGTFMVAAGVTVFIVNHTLGGLR